MLPYLRVVSVDSSFKIQVLYVQKRQLGIRKPDFLFVLFVLILSSALPTYLYSGTPYKTRSRAEIKVRIYI